jgi:hypothetical protein
VAAAADARLIGALNLVLLVTGSFPMIVQSRTIVPGDAAATAVRIAELEPLFRLGIVSNLAMCAVLVFVGWLWYGLLGRVDRRLARLMLVLLLVSLPIAMLNELNAYAALRFAQAGEPTPMQLALDLHYQGLIIASLFWGFWLFPLGLLVYRSGFLPKALGVLLMLGSPGYPIRFLQALLWPGSEATLWTNPPLVLTHVAELAMMVWLLVKGVDTAALQRSACQRS